MKVKRREPLARGLPCKPCDCRESVRLNRKFGEEWHRPLAD